MRFERLVIDSGDHSMAVDLHPRLTVLTGLEQMERDALTSEFIGALGSARPGVHLELQADSGNRFAVFRPEGAPARVIDVDNRLDATQAFADEAGRIDLLARAGLDTHSARRLMVVGSQGLMEDVEADRLVLQLSGVDQHELWSVADSLRDATENLEREADDLGSTVEDADAITAIEERHQAFEDAQEQAEQVRRVNFLVAGLAALFSIPMARTLGLVGVAVLAGIAVAAVGVSMLYWRRAEAARRAESEALAAAGAQSYLGFHLQRVNGLLGSDATRRRLLTAAERQRNAESRWTVLTGGVSLGWALQHRDDILRAAESRQRVQPLDVELGGNILTAASHALGERLASVRNVGPGHESFPLLLDEPFDQIEPALVAPLLSLLLEHSASQQVMLLTASESIASWARLEAMTGTVEVVEPTPVTL